MAVYSYFPLTLPPEAREGFEQTWKSRVGAVDTFPGFLGTELLALPNRDEYVVLTRFETEEQLEAWLSSDNFTKGHRGESYEQYKREDHPMLKGHKVFEILDS